MSALKNGLLYGSMFVAILLLSPVPAQAAGPGGAYTVAKGDCLWTIAARKDVYGDPWKWPLLFEANRGQISNPDLIQPGWSLNVATTPSAAQIAEAKAYARHYKEESGQAPPGQEAQAPVAPPPAVAPVAAAPQPVEAEKPRQGMAWPLASLLLLVFLVVGVLVGKRMRRAPEAMAAPMKTETVEDTTEIVAGPAAVQPQAAKPEAPSVAVVEAGPMQAPSAEAIPAPAEPPAATLPTESETVLRADQAPDPMHPEDHKHAA